MASEPIWIRSPYFFNIQLHITEPQNAPLIKGVFKIKQQRIKQEGELGRNIRRIRIRKECGVEELSRKMQLEGCDITRQAIVKIEAGNRHITVKELLAVKAALDTTFDDIFNFEGEID